MQVPLTLLYVTCEQNKIKQNVNKTNSRNSHHKENVVFSFLFCIHMRQWMFTELTVIIS